MQRQQYNETSAAARKAWQAPRLARLHAGSAETGSATEEDGEFTSS